MAKDLHKGLQLDDKFAAELLKVERAVNNLHHLANEFNTQDHKPVNSQIDALIRAKGDFVELGEIFRNIRNK